MYVDLISHAASQNILLIKDYGIALHQVPFERCAL
jgi:hypothetical protein